MGFYEELERRWNSPNNLWAQGGTAPAVSMDSNQAGATMASRYITAKYLAILGFGVAPVGQMAKGASGISKSQYYKAYGIFKRPIISLGVYKQIRGARTAMFLSKTYSKIILAGSVFNFGRNVQMARDKEYKRLGINIFGPPLSLFAYDTYMARNSGTEEIIAAVDREQKEQSRVGSSLTSKPKTRGKHSYVPSVTSYLAYYEGGKGTHENSICRKGYRYVAKSGTLGLCVRK